MKIRNGFVSNSSSTAFIITNTSNEVKTLVDFVTENPQLIEEFKEQYEWYKDNPEYIQENLIKSAEENYIEFSPGRPEYCVFGDEDGTLIGKIFDYILRDGGTSESFNWRFNEYLRWLLWKLEMDLFQIVVLLVL